MTRLNETGRKVYAALRREAAKGRGTPLPRSAADCFRLALDWQGSGRSDFPGRYGPDSIWRGLGGHDGRVFACHGESRVRWIEAPESKGLRFAGTAEALARLDHSGWYMDSDGFGELARGVVYLLPGRKGRTRALAAVADPFNSDADGRGPALVSLEIFEADPEAERADGARTLSRGDVSRLPSYCRGLGAWTEAAGESAMREAARSADGFADRYAEAERDYQDGWRAGVRAREKSAEAVESAKAWKAAARALRSALRSRHALPLGERRAVVRILVQAVRGHCRDMIEARDAARALRSDAPTWEPEREGWRNGYAEGV